MMFDPAALDPVLESRVRVGVLAILAGGDTADFTYLRGRLDLTDGNLATHIRRLEEARYVSVRKSFAGRRPHTTYAITSKGRSALERHVSALSEALRGPRPPSDEAVSPGKKEKTS